MSNDNEKNIIIYFLNEVLNIFESVLEIKLEIQ